MARSVRPSVKKLPQPSLFMLLMSWTAMFVYGVLPTGIPHIFFTLCYALTMDNPDLGQAMPFILRITPSIFLYYRMVKFGRRNRYTMLIAAGLLLSAVGDVFFMWKDETKFLIAMAFYAAMHAIFAIALGFESFGGLGFGSSASLAMIWYLLVLPHLSGLYTALVPFYICLVCLTFWRGCAQPDFDCYGTKTCGVVATLFFLISHWNFSLNSFGVVTPYDYLNVMTVVFFSVGQMLTAISTFDENVVFNPRNLRRI